MLLIKNGIMIDPSVNVSEKMDLVIEDGKIKKKGTGFHDKEFDKVIDAAGMYVIPGLIDVHVHFRDPGFTYKEDIETGAKAAAKGGFTTVVMMANTKPVIDSKEVLKYVLEKGQKTGINVLTCAAITKGLLGKEKTEMEELKKAGAVGFTDDGIPILDAVLVKEAMEEAARLQVPLSFHEEDPAFIKSSGINQGKVAQAMGLLGASSLAEEIMVARDGFLALSTGCKINIQHISSAKSVDLVRFYKKKGVDIHAEASPHHFTLTEEDVINFGTLAKMNPPVRTKEDREAIINGLIDGTIDMIATDHAPHSMQEKNKDFHKAPSGIIGLETSLALGITQLVRTKKLTMLELIKKMSYHPACLYGLDKGTLKEGSVADLAIINPTELLETSCFVSKANNTPFKNRKLYGKVHYTLCNGKIVYKI